ncbi:MAG: hypothetical protein HZB26_13660 [Candidatus Hydrogenedentes bacterium]|nr:hypothetical protein [Candidatus Hydrogenedentota bacterium]
MISAQDRNILRELAGQIAEIAALPAQQETISLWKALNALKPVRPMVMIDQIPWHEMEVEHELTLQCENDFCREYETRLRRTLYRWKHLRGDMVVEPMIDVPRVIHNSGFGIDVVENKAVLDPKNDVVGHYYIDQMNTEEDVQKIRAPHIELDQEATARALEMTHEIFDGVLTVRLQGVHPSFAPWDVIVGWHGVESLLRDLIERPEFMHEIISRLTNAYLSMLDQLEGKGLLGAPQGTIHCCGAYTDELPAPDYNPEQVRAKDLWTCGMAQVFSAVSPAMHQEFELNYAVQWYERFGLVYYGCCEPLHDKIDIIRRIPHVRKISMSPWVDTEKGAERIGRDFVFSRKPSPAFLAVQDWEPDAVRADLQDTLSRCARHGCPLELILKDISTVRYEPQRLWEWAEIAMKLVQG